MEKNTDPRLYKIISQNKMFATYLPYFFSARNRKQTIFLSGTKRQWRKGGLREGGLMMGTSEEGTGRGMGGERDEASGGGIARGKNGAR